MMQANIANFVRQEVRVSKRKPLLPIFEAVSNSLDAIGDRRRPGTIRVTVLRQPELLESSRGAPHTFIVEDNRIGFNDENMAAFDELYSERKIRHGGKGRGRFAFLKVFEKVEITSTFETAQGKKARVFTFDINYVGYREAPKNSADDVGTKVILSGMRSEYAERVSKSSISLAREFISHFLPILLSNRRVEIIIDDEDQIRLAKLVRGELLIDKGQTDFAVGSRTFSLLSVKLRPKRVNIHHRIILAASSREVSGHNLEKFIPVLTPGPLELDGEPDGFFYVAIVEGEYLDQVVDPMRVTFTDDDEDQPDEDETQAHDDEPLVPSPDLFGEPQSIGEIRREALNIVREQLDVYIKAAIAHRSEAMENYIRRDGMGYHFIKRKIPELAKNLKSTDDRTIEASLHAAAYTERRRRSAQADQLLSASPKEKSEASYFKRWTEIVESLGDVAKSDLASYVAHRRAILDLIEDALRATPDGGYRREEVMHSIVFPRGKQTGDVGYEQQNLWLVDERLTFHEHLFSDLTIKRITGGDVEAAERPDLTIYESGFASFHDGARPPAQLVLIELKQPARRDTSRDDVVSKTLDYVEKLKSGSAKTEGGAVIDIQNTVLTMVYILADWTADFKRHLIREQFVPMPGDVGSYLYRPYENILFIAMSFERLVESARRRNRIFFKKLGIE
jgi:hypothetical protein